MTQTPRKRGLDSRRMLVIDNARIHPLLSGDERGARALRLYVPSRAVPRPVQPLHDLGFALPPSTAARAVHWLVDALEQAWLSRREVNNRRYDAPLELVPKPGSGEKCSTSGAGS